MDLQSEKQLPVGLPGSSPPPHPVPSNNTSAPNAARVPRAPGFPMYVLLADRLAVGVDAKAVRGREVPRDVELPAIGDVVLQDAESGIAKEFTIDEQLRDDFARAAQAHRDEVARTLRRCDAPLLTLRTDRDWIADVVRFVANRRRGAMAAR